MKKLLIGVLAVACCVAFSAPVFAEIKVGGMISAEQFYWGMSKERRQFGGVADGTATNLDDYGSTEFAMGQPWNRLNMQYISDDKKIGGMLELRTGGQKGGGNSTNAAGGNAVGENNFVWELAYIDWHLNPNFYLRVGRQTQTFAIYSPEQQMGHNHGHIVLAGFGNIHGATSRDGVRAYIKFNDMIRMELQMLNPDSDGTSAAPGTTGDLLTTTSRRGAGAVLLPALPATAGGVAAEENTIPRFDISLPIKVGNFSIEPSFSWARSSYTQIAAGSDDEYDSWGASLGFKAGFGPFTLSGEYTYGQNLGGHSYVGAGNGMPSTYTISGTNIGIEDTTTHSAWLQAEFNFGPFGIQLIGGIEKAENDGNPNLSRNVDTAEFDVTRYAVGLQVPIYIAKNFKVVPQAWYYNYGDSADVGGTAAAPRNSDTDLGNETTIGVFWQLSF